MIGLAPIKLPQGLRFITIAPLLNDWFSTGKVTPVTMSYPKMHYY